jgi:peptidoglycan/LPS O-acetylase OafA/YrhL
MSHVEVSQVEVSPTITLQDRPSPTKSENHIEILDALRGIAILLVLGFHFCEGLEGLTRVENAFYGLFRVGWMGVDLFFVLSGFLIIGILADTKETPRRMFKFYMRRTLRIFPLYYAALLLIFVILPLAVPLATRLHVSGHQHTFGGLVDASARQNQAWFWTYTTNILASINESRLGSYGHFWSLAVEEQFYLICPVVIYHLSLSRALDLCRYCVIAALCIRMGLLLAGAYDAANFLMPCRMDALAVGGYVALAWRMGKITPAFVRMSRWVALGALGLLLALFLGRHFRLDATDNIVRSVGYTVIALFFGSLMVLCVMGRQLQWLNQRVFRTFGKYSYAIYVIHRPLHPILFSLLGFSALTTAWKFPMLRLLPFLILAPAACLLLGKISWVFYESRFLALKKFHSY